MTAEQQEHLYGADASEWLRRWDSGDSVWSIEMGGLGPGYEQCIHITTAEIMRFLLSKDYDRKAWVADTPAWERDRAEIDRAVMAVPAVKELGLSGSQWGAAFNLALNLLDRGPIGVMADERVKDRHIQVSRNFPGSGR